MNCTPIKLLPKKKKVFKKLNRNRPEKVLLKDYLAKYTAGFSMTMKPAGNIHQGGDFVILHLAPSA